MAVTVVIPSNLARIVEGAERRTTVEASTVAGVIGALDERWPGLRARVLDEDGAVRPHLRLFVDGEECGLDAAVGQGAEVVLLAAMSGG